jgi:hypothetical protein
VPHEALWTISGEFSDEEQSPVDGDDVEAIEDSDDEQGEFSQFDWSKFDIGNGGDLSSWEQLGAGYDREFANIGESPHLAPSDGSKGLPPEEKLTAYDLAICKAFAYKVKTQTTDTAWPMTSYAFPQDPPLPGLDQLRSRVAFLAGFKPQLYDCCPNSCICYSGPHDKLTACPYCRESRFHADGQPRKRFTYIPLEPRLRAFATNTRLAKMRQYRANYQHETGKIADVFDSKCYRNLRTENIKIGETTLPQKYFADARDVALGLSTDGFAPFKRRKQTAWPLIIFDYNLPPDVRFHLEHILSVGVIPGPKKPKDADSFLWPLVQELFRLARGVPAFDVLSGTRFALRAFLILVFGDIPAIAMVMRMKGHNGYAPCRMCNIRGLPVPDSAGKTLYVPLDRSTHPNVICNALVVKHYDPRDLPLRTHNEFMQQADEVDLSETNKDAIRLSREYGIKGQPVLSHLHSLKFPLSFPYDFMHLIWENILKNLILHWTGAFKGLDDGVECYELSGVIWRGVGDYMARAGSTVPSAYGVRVLNIALDGVSVSAEMWSFWALFVGPVLL